LIKSCEPEGSEGPLGKIAGGSSQLSVLPEQLGWPAARSPWSTEFSWGGGLLEIECSQTPSWCALRCFSTPQEAGEMCSSSARVQSRGPCARSMLLLRRQLLVKTACDDRRARWERNCPHRGGRFMW